LKVKEFGFCFAFGVVVFVAAGVLQWVDNKTTPESVKESKGCGDQGCFTFFDAVYFIVVTVSVVD
jgi:potassium large conductance calcium-activated channel subfamily M alpha protein 1